MKNICVYCGSSPGRNAEYASAATVLAKALVDRDIGLVYGGANIGIMGVLADSVMQLGGRAVGVIPTALMQKEVAHPGLSELHVTRSMHERKSLMAELSDGFVALPGGIGTFEELFEIWTWAQLGFHQKPCGLLNVAGYFDALITFLDHAVNEQFVQPACRSMLVVEQDANRLLDRFVGYQPPGVHQWVGENET